MTNTTPIDPDVIRAEAQKDAWLYDDINDACPHPFNTVEGVIYKDAFLAAKAQQRSALTLLPRGAQA